jgi:amino acid adenylation domain-containing protein
MTRRQTVGGDPFVVFMFSGQGNQYVNMCRDLYDNEPVFRREMEYCFDYLKNECDVDIQPVLYPALPERKQWAEEELFKPVYTSAVKFAVEYALAKLLLHWGVRPAAMIGYSLGEYVAATLAGVFSLEDALQLSALRGRLMSRIPEGAMLSVPLAEGEVLPYLNGDLWLAGVNGPALCNVSGTPEAIDALKLEMETLGHECLRLRVPRAMHSDMMRPIVEELEDAVAAVKRHEPRIPYISCVTGKWIKGNEAVDPAYWGRHLLRTVRFYDGLTTLFQEPDPVFLQVGPGRGLSMFVRRHLQAATHTPPVVNMVRHHKEPVDDRLYHLQQIGNLWMSGVKVDWSPLYTDKDPRKIHLPTYPFKRQRLNAAMDRLERILKSGSAGSVMKLVEGSHGDDEATAEDNGELTANSRPRPRLQSQYVSPEGGTQQLLAGIWANVLGFQRVGVEDNFFELGGDSLKAVIVCSRIQKELNVKVSLADFFQEPTIGALSRRMSLEEERVHAVPPAEIRDVYPLSPAQERMVSLHNMEPDSVVYNLPTACRLIGALDKERLTRAFADLVQRHESLRTSFFDTAEGMRQRIHPHVEVEIQWLPEDEPPDPEELAQPFDLARPPLVRASIRGTGPGEYLLLVDMPHIVSDGTSMAVMMKELLDLYRGEPLPPKRVDYKDVAMWLRSDEQLLVVAAQEDFWRQELAGELPVLNMPLDYPRPARLSYEGHLTQFIWERHTASHMKRLARREEATLYMVLLSIYSILLSKLGGQEELLLGTPSAGRSLPELQGIVGMFVNTVVLRLFPYGDMTFREFLADVKQRALKALENQDVPFEKVVEIAGGSGDQSRNPLFDTMFALQNVGVPEMEVPGLKLEAYPVDSGTSKFDLSMRVEERDDELLAFLEYRTRLFKEESVVRWGGYIRRVAETVIQRPDILLRDIEVMGEAEREWMLHRLNDTAADYPAAETILHLFRRQVSASPHAVALVGPRSFGAGDDHTHLTYDCLKRHGRAVAGKVNTMGVDKGSIVALQLEPSVHMIVAILGVWSAGGAYLPIDPAAPSGRKAGILADAQPDLTLTGDDETVWFSLDEGENSAGSRMAMAMPAAEDLAYIIYTSGSTGTPKGVMVQHDNLANQVMGLRDRFELDAANRYLLLTAFTFDVSLMHICLPLVTGGRLFSISNETRQDPGKLWDFIVANRIDILNIVPAFMETILQHKDRRDISLDYLFIGGDAFHRDLHQRLRRAINPRHLINIYGPTETTINATLWEGDGALEAGVLPIGRPLTNYRIYLLESNLRPVPLGAVGEICIGGKGVARGYLNRPELTAEKFVDFEDSRLYRSGDLGRYRPDGTIEFCGRKDRQVKIRGFRVELGEIESRMLGHENVKEAVVLVRENSGEKSLCAYFSLHGKEEEPDTGAITEYLRGQLPDYMIPTAFVLLEKIPLTANGKVDRRALPDPAEVSRGGKQEVAAPRNDVEWRLANMFARILTIERAGIDIHDSFFNLGGHSLKATFLLSSIEREFGARVSLSQIFSSPSIAAIADLISNGAADRHQPIPRLEKKSYYPLLPWQKGIYFLQQLEHIGCSYNMPAAFRCEGNVNPEKLQTVFNRLLKRHPALRTSFHIVGNRPVQRIEEGIQLKIESLGRIDDETEAIRAFIRPFDLSRPPLLRVGLADSDNDGRLLIIDAHHIAADGISLGILVEEFVRLYKGEALDVLPLRVVDAAQWLAMEKNRRTIETQYEYWLDQFKDGLPQLELPLDFARPETQLFTGALVRRTLGNDVKEGLTNLAQEAGVTLFSVILSVFSLLVARLGGQDRVVIGTVTSGREHWQYQPLVGMLIKTLPVVCPAPAEGRFADFAGEIHRRAIRAFEHQDVELDELADRLGVGKDLGRNPLFDVMFVLQNMNMPVFRLPGVDIVPVAVEPGVSKFDLTLFVEENEMDLLCNFEYNSGLFRQETVEEIARYFEDLVRQLRDCRDLELDQINMGFEDRYDWEDGFNDDLEDE